MKIIYISGRTGTGKSTALSTLCWEDNIIYGNIHAGMQTNRSSVIGIDEYRWEPIKERDLDYLSVVWVTHLYIATEWTPDFNKK
jgi:ABC-type lipoprotein export system ATPase subunit